MRRPGGRRKLLLNIEEGLQLATGAASSAGAPERDEMEHIETMIKRYESGKIPKEPWLDRLTFRRIEEINQANPLRTDRVYLFLELDTSERCPVIFQEPICCDPPPLQLLMCPNLTGKGDPSRQAWCAL